MLSVYAAQRLAAMRQAADVERAETVRRIREAGQSPEESGERRPALRVLKPFGQPRTAGRS
ncbi:MAG: hypothetical protein ACREN4_02760 [Candidatus Dormibacteria bacterium]